MNINDDVNFSIPSSSFNLPQAFTPVYHDSISNTTTNIENNNDDKGSIICQTSIKLKNKKHQPKYRSTKRPPSERRFQCDHCESRFFTQKDVKRHLVVHTGLRNFACPYCTQKFGRKDHLVRHAKKSHGEDTRSFKRKNRLQNLNQPSNVTESNQNKKTKRSKRSKKNEIDYNTGNEPSTCPTASQHTANVSPTTSNTITATSIPANFVNANIYNNNGTNRIPTTSYDNFNNSVIMLSSTSPQLLGSHSKMTLVDNPTTSKFTASLSYSRNYPNCPNNYLNSSPNFNSNMNTNNNYNQFLPGTSNQQPVQMSQSSSDNYYVNGNNYNKLPINNSSYANISHQLETPHFPNASNMISNSIASNNNVSFKAIASSIVDGFNTCIELEYNSVGMNPNHNINEPHPSNITYPDSSNPRFHTQFK